MKQSADSHRHHFLQLFTTDVFPKLKGKEFHITGESYAVSPMSALTP
jgi:cathepsin A (carboxypeptidase C)